MANYIITLQDAAYKTILNEFSRFASAYLTTKNEDLIRNFYFLQRFYTQILLDELEITKKLKACHLELLLNKYMKKMRVKTLRCHISIEEIIEKLKLIGPSLVELDFENTLDYRKLLYFQLGNSFFDAIKIPTSPNFKMSKTELCCDILKQVLPHVYNVTKICIYKWCTDDMLELLAASCPHLTELYITDSRMITSEGLKSLCVEADNIVEAQCPLKLIELTFIEGIEEGVAFILNHIPTLQVVKYKHLVNVLHNMHKLHNETVYNLTYMNLFGFKNKIRLDCLKMCPHLKQIESSISKEVDLKIIALFTELESLNICTTTLVYDVININNFLLLNGRKLKHLHLRGNFELSISTLIQSCPNLQKLHLIAVRFQQPDKKAVMPFKYLLNLKLCSLESSGNFYSGESIEFLLNSCPKLEKLFVMCYPFSVAEILERKLLISPLINTLKLLHCADGHLSIECFKQVVINSNSLRALYLPLGEQHAKMLYQTIKQYRKNIMLSDIRCTTACCCVPLFF